MIRIYKSPYTQSKIRACSEHCDCHIERDIIERDVIELEIYKGHAPRIQFGEDVRQWF